MTSEPNRDEWEQFISDTAEKREATIKAKEAAAAEHRRQSERVIGYGNRPMTPEQLANMRQRFRVERPVKP